MLNDENLLSFPLPLFNREKRISFGSQKKWKPEKQTVEDRNGAQWDIVCLVCTREEVGIPSTPKGKEHRLSI